MHKLTLKNFGVAPLAALLLGALSWADNGPNHQTTNNNYGVSAGNAKDSSRAFCCGGTAGSLLQAQGGQLLVLSNNHVFARSDAAAVGESIIQPGLIDAGCRAGNARVIGNLTTYPKLGTNVDAATALLKSGTMNTNGYIEDVGQVSGTASPAVGAAVAKSGRTTGLTSGTIEAINASVSVQYQKGCGSGKKFTVSYKNQIVTSPAMIAAGDSGSLLVDVSCKAVGLLFAGDSSGRAIGNPVAEVLQKVGGAFGQPVSFVTGANCLLSGSATGGSSGRRGPSASVLEFARSVVEEHAPELMRGPVIGVGVGASDEYPAEAVLVVYIDRTQGVRPDLPAQVRGLRVKRVLTDPFVALPACSACADACGAGGSR